MKSLYEALSKSLIKKIDKKPYSAGDKYIVKSNNNIPEGLWRLYINNIVYSRELDTQVFILNITQLYEVKKYTDWFEFYIVNNNNWNDLDTILNAIKNNKFSFSKSKDCVGPYNSDILN